MNDHHLDFLERKPRQRVPAAERRDALIEAAVHEFAHGGLHGTPVDRIARHVGVAQPYVFSLFGSKRELFLAAVERGFELVGETFERSPPSSIRRRAPPDIDVTTAMGNAYVQLLDTDRDYLMLQHQAYAACDDVGHPRAGPKLLRAPRGPRRAAFGRRPERIDEFFRYGMWLNVAAAMGVEDLSAGCEWIRAEQQQS